ncbi:MAG: PepSY-associated TM helix domain-containing protein, partial [Niveispirillum sp.]|nr:PepSY-associated TM helix domain-containing protein [Niveispirillum sp.]
TGPVWSWFLDIFAVACLIFCVTGLFLLHLHAGKRPSTWPLVGLGLVAPMLLLILLIH